MRRWLPFFLVLCSGPAAAETIVVVGHEDCARIVARYEPAADVAYRPGVDVEGRPVAPADLAPQIVAPDSFAIPITFDIAPRLGSRFGMEAGLGTVNYRDGVAYYNGQRLDDDGAAELAALCQDALTRAGAYP